MLMLFIVLFYAFYALNINSREYLTNSVALQTNYCELMSPEVLLVRLMGNLALFLYISMNSVGSVLTFTVVLIASSTYSSLVNQYYIPHPARVNTVSTGFFDIGI